MGRRKKKQEVEEKVEKKVEETVEPVVEKPEVVEKPAEESAEKPVVEKPKPVAKRPKANKFNAGINPGQELRVQAETIKKRPAVSVEDMIAENKNATVSTDYQKYLRKLMKQAGGRA